MTQESIMAAYYCLFTVIFSCHSEWGKMMVSKRLLLTRLSHEPIESQRSNQCPDPYIDGYTTK